MEINQKWREKPITKKQLKLLRDLASESFRELTRGEASDLIQHWLTKEKWSYSQDVLEDNK